MAVDDQRAAKEEILGDLGNSQQYIEKSIRASRRSDPCIDSFLNGDERWRGEAIRLYRESEELARLRRRSHWCAQVTMFIGLGFIAAAVALIGIRSVGGIPEALVSVVASASAFYLRTTSLRTFNQLLDHIVEVERISNERSHGQAYWQAVRTIMDSADPKLARSIIKELPMRG